MNASLIVSDFFLPQWFTQIESIARAFWGILPSQINVIAIITAYIAYQQYQTNKYKLRLDLFEKRFAVFQSIENLFKQVAINGTVDQEKLAEFRSGISYAPFLFPKEIVGYISTVEDKAIKLYVTCKRIDSLSTSDIEEKIFENLDEIPKEMSNYLKATKRQKIDSYTSRTKEKDCKSPSKNSLGDLQSELLEWFSCQFREAQNIFTKYLILKG